MGGDSANGKEAIVMILISKTYLLSNSHLITFSFRFDESAIKTLSGSNDSLYKAVEEDPIHLDDDYKDVTETEVRLRDRRKVAHRRSAPPSSQRSLRDSVGSLDYLSESHVDVDSEDEESVQSEVGVVNNDVIKCHLLYIDI